VFILDIILYILDTVKSIKDIIGNFFFACDYLDGSHTQNTSIPFIASST